MIEKFVNTILSTILNLPKESKLVETLTFFIYDSIKILLLLFLMILIIGYLRTYLSQKKLRSFLSSKPGVANFFASLFGAVTPFCSCSSIPFFMSFIKAGVPLGVAFSFLITSPLVNEYVAVLLFATFGWKVAVSYVIAGMLIGITAGLVLGKMKLEKHIEKEFRAINNPKLTETKFKSQKQRFLFGLTEAKNITKNIWGWILVGVAIGAVLHGYIPEELLHSYISKVGIFGVPIAVLIGVPLYANCAGIVPIALVLFQKGIPLGTALAFMMATAALSLPEAVILRRIMKLKLIAIFYGVVTIGIIILGYSFNFLQRFLI